MYVILCFAIKFNENVRRIKINISEACNVLNSSKHIYKKMQYTGCTNTHVLCLGPEQLRLTVLLN